jgi:hypothetical protein
MATADGGRPGNDRVRFPAAFPAVAESMLSRVEFRGPIHAGDPLADMFPGPTSPCCLENGSMPSGPVRAAAGFVVGGPASGGVAPAMHQHFLRGEAKDLALRQVGQMQALVFLEERVK